ncbi:Receptor-type tyrosine-protein phosphatase epsilon-like [Oopsacas minuta]|uniref:Receptor-type tyrosine-protein phosphatase epsilon-like n=1 Tax=Oopsacas minuta TaxID=111878 RepID=A0AAV7JJ02_9METZ|nr:Receptor-type tyrosine-protein phosphatase epsilon-like [Oopsacas minuta]
MSAWTSFKWVCENFLGNKKSSNYREGVETLLNAYEKMGCRMLLKLHFLHSHLDSFPENLGAVSDEQDERFHQTYRRWKPDTKVSGMRAWCPITVGGSSEIIPTRYIKGSRTLNTFNLVSTFILPDGYVFPLSL